MSIWRTSASQLEQAIFCGEQWKRVHIDKQPRPPGIALHVGTSLHKVSEYNFTIKMATGEDEPLDVLRDVARDGYIYKLRDEGVYLSRDETSRKTELLNEGLTQAVSLSESFRNDFAPMIQPIAVEHEVKLLDEEIEVSWLGYVDLEDGTTARDLKSASRAWSESQADASTQATLYPHLIEATTGKRPERFVFNIFRKLKGNAEHQEIVTTRDESDWQALRRKAAHVKKMIDAGLLPPADQSSWRCSEAGCGYFSDCKFISERRRRLPNR
jgi:hypothetical protein